MYNTDMNTPRENKITLERATANDCERIYALLTEAFDKSERRNFSEFVKAANTDRYIMLDIMRGDTVVGFIGAWALRGFLYVEHLATYTQYRNMGYGAAALELLQLDHTVIVLEIEPPATEMQKRRRGFYERLGFVMNDCEYLQPPLRVGDMPFPLKLMSYPAALSDTPFVVREIYDNVYHADHSQVTALYESSRLSI